MIPIKLDGKSKSAGASGTMKEPGEDGVPAVIGIADGAVLLTMELEAVELTIWLRTVEVLPMSLLSPS